MKEYGYSKGILGKRVVQNLDKIQERFEKVFGMRQKTINDFMTRFNRREI